MYFCNKRDLIVQLTTDKQNVYKLINTGALKKLGFEYHGSGAYSTPEISIFNKVVHLTGMLLGSKKSCFIIDFILKNINQTDDFWIHQTNEIDNGWGLKYQWCITQYSNEIITQEEYCARFDKYVQDLYKQGTQIPEIEFCQKIRAEHQHIDRTPEYISLEIVNEIKKLRHLLIKQISNG